MSQTLPIPPPGFEALSLEEQIDYVQSLWDHIAAQPEKVPVPDWHRQVLSERVANYEASPNAGKTWEQLEQELNEDTNPCVD